MAPNKKKKKKKHARPASSSAVPAAARKEAPVSASDKSRRSITQQQALRRSKHRKARLKRIAIVLAIFVVLGAVVGYILSNRAENQKVVSKLTAKSCKLDSKSDPGSEHVPAATYKVKPPSGGHHHEAPSPPGIFQETNIPPDANVVHSLEHGYIAIWYKPGIAEPDLKVLQAVADQFQIDTLLIPRADMDTPIAATAWHKRLLCTKAEKDTLTQFVREYRNKGPEKVAH